MITSIISGIYNLIEPILLLVGSFSQNNSFPKPLSPEEEQQYLLLYENGDEEAKNILIERNLRLVAHIVKKYNNTGKEIDDLISIGTIGLIKAINTFDTSKNVRLATYAARCIDNEVLMTIRSGKKTQSEISIHDPIGIDREGNELSLIDLLGTDADEVIDEVHLNIEVRKLYKKMSNVLKEREKLILKLRYGLLNGECKTQREIAEELGISRSYVSRIEKKSVEKLAKELNYKL